MDRIQNHPFWSKKLPFGLFAMGLFALLMSATQLLSSDIYKIKYFLFSYVTAYFFYLAISMGSLFLVLIQHLAKGGWGVVLRRIPEHLMRSIPLMLILFIPIYLGLDVIFKWADPIYAAKDHLVQIKAPYLNKGFFVIRAISYFVIWGLITRFYYKQSVEQDVDGDEKRTIKMQNRSAVCILLFALSYTFASFDWLMSLSPHWFSTIFGVYVFANSVLAALCVISLFTMILRRAGYLTDLISVEHYHDLGKLIYGFVVFWAYISFSQYFLIWYANIPEETVWYSIRNAGNWALFVKVMLFMHFVFPLFAFMSRYAKRNLKSHAAIISVVLIACYLDFYFIVMPAFPKYSYYANPLLDIGLLLGIGGIYSAVFIRRLNQTLLIPKKDPRLSESVNFHNF